MTNETNDKCSDILVHIVAQADRVEFLPKHLGCLAAGTEHFTFKAMREMVSAYEGGYWEYYELSNGGYFIAPSSAGSDHSYTPVKLIVESIGYSGLVSYQAAGIIATAFGLNQMIEACVGEHSHHEDYALLGDQIRKLYDYVPLHPEHQQIYAALE